MPLLIVQSIYLKTNKKWRGFANAVLRKINEEKKDLLKFKDNVTLLSQSGYIKIGKSIRRK